MSLGTDLLKKVDEEFPSDSLMKPYFQRDLEEFVNDNNDDEETLNNYFDDMEANQHDYTEQDQVEIRKLHEILIELTS